ncbi:Non-histone chromosomal protein HMG-14 [Fukomys damarensis]|uniref:Non-histone chromosomal protein HMG-14 n=1 Tax=Fukomys damarensis TaxID=885580 RepID=A0A091DUN5_FUKDA|nr:Non-histone chromosomal protein HMG-14 [Fukomys damarensis]
MKPKEVAAKDNSSEKKGQRKQGGKGKQAEVAPHKTKDLLAENGETNENTASDEAKEKEAKSD